MILSRNLLLAFHAWVDPRDPPITCSWYRRTNLSLARPKISLGKRPSGIQYTVYGIRYTVCSVQYAVYTTKPPGHKIVNISFVCFKKASILGIPTRARTKTFLTFDFPSNSQDVKFKMSSNRNTPKDVNASPSITYPLTCLRF